MSLKQIVFEFGTTFGAKLYFETLFGLSVRVDIIIYVNSSNHEHPTRDPVIAIKLIDRIIYLWLTLASKINNKHLKDSILNQR